MISTEKDDNGLDNGINLFFFIVKSSVSQVLCKIILNFLGDVWNDNKLESLCLNEYIIRNSKVPVACNTKQ